MGISIINQIQKNTGVSMEAAAGAAATGSLMGKNATEVESPMSLLADSAEELTFSMGEKEQTKLSERKTRSSTDKESILERVRLYQELIHKSGKSREVDDLVDAMRTAISGRQALREAHARFKDETDAFAALQYAREKLRENKTACDAIDEALAMLEAESGPRIIAGIHAGLEAAGFTELGDADSLKNLYRKIIFDFGNAHEAFAHIQEKYGSDGFDQAVAFLFKTLGADLASCVPSDEPAHLANITKDLGVVRLLQSVYVLCDQVMTRWENTHGVKNAQLSSMSLMDAILSWRDKAFLGKSDVDQVVVKANAPDIEREVLFLQDLLGATRQFPDRLFDGTQGRSKVVDAVQEAVDYAVEREDEFLAQGDA